jgi:capsular polysaccharide biosynthesis protein
MLKLAIFIVQIWNYRHQILLPIVVLPLLVLSISFAYNPLYEATTTISVDRGKASSPVLMNVSDPSNSLILERRLKSESVIRDTILSTGAVVGFDLLSKEDKQGVVRDFNNRLRMTVLSDDMIRINYKGQTPEKAENVLEVLVGNFIDEILAPERVRVGDLLSSLGGQVQLYNEQEKQANERLNVMQSKLSKASGKSRDKLLKELVAIEFNVQKAIAQKDLAQGEYEDLLMQSRSLMGGQFHNEPNAIMWIVDPALSLSTKRDMSYHMNLLMIALQASLVLALVLVMYKKLTDATLKTDEEVYDAFGLKILGHIPNLGHVESEDGKLIITTHSKVL